MNIRAIGVIIIITSTIMMNAQNRSVRFAIQPSINLNKVLNNGYKLNLKIGGRQNIYRNDGNSGEYQQTEIALLLSKKIGVSHNLAGGYTLQIVSESLVHRTNQQYTSIHDYSSMRLSQRLSSDQTYEDDGNVKVRLRYRLTVLLPLSGHSSDPSELYLKLGNAYVNSYDTEYDLEIRLTSFIGYKFRDNNKLELGFDNRINSFVRGGGLGIRSRIGIAWFVVI